MDPDDQADCRHTLVDGRYVEELRNEGEVRSTAFQGFAVELDPLFR